MSSGPECENEQQATGPTLRNEESIASDYAVKQSRLFCEPDAIGDVHLADDETFLAVTNIILSLLFGHSFIGWFRSFSVTAMFIQLCNHHDGTSTTNCQN